MDATAKPNVTLIKPAKGWMGLDLGELWTFRELLYFFSWRDLKVRYKQTLLGFTWAIIGPVVQTVIFTLIFNKVGRIETDGIPAPLYNMAGLVAWRYFQSTLTSSSTSLVNNSAMLTKIYFPRLMVPLSCCVTGLVDLAIGLGATLVLMAILNVIPAWTIVLLPLFTIVMFAATFGTSLFFSALNVRFRDVTVIVPFLLQIWMYASVILSAGWIKEHFGAWVYVWALNPLVGVVEGFRWCLMHNQPGASIHAPWLLLAIGLVPTLLMLLGGMLYFRRVENQFADIM